MTSAFNVWSKWDPLTHCMVGSTVNADYFEHVANSEIRDKLTKMLIETQQDMDHFADVLTQHGVTVTRPVIDRQDRLAPDQPAQLRDTITLQPRDHYAVLGPHMIVAHESVMHNGRYPTVITDAVQSPESAWHDLCVNRRVKLVACPSWTLVGADLFIDNGLQTVYTPHGNITARLMDQFKPTVHEWCEQWLPGVQVHWSDIGGHTDGCFHTCKPGVIISREHIHNYRDTFPKWDVLTIPDPDWSTFREWSDLKHKTKGRYWIPGEEHNDQLLEFVNAWLSQWVGYAEETVFDVNILMINEHTACVSHHNHAVFDYFKRHRITPIIVPMRHRYFWDGGLHCVSCDTHRQGELTRYL